MLHFPGFVDGPVADATKALSVRSWCGVSVRLLRPLCVPPLLLRPATARAWLMCFCFPAPHAGYPVRVHKRRATVKYMFHDPDDIKWVPADTTVLYAVIGHLRCVKTHQALITVLGRCLS